MKKIILPAIAVLLLSTGSAQAMLWNFDDGVGDGLQGWYLESYTGFDLNNPGSGGNPGGFAQLLDTSPGGSGGLAVAPITGNLGGFTAISWDAFLPDNWNFLNPVVSIVLTSETTTIDSVFTYTPVMTVDNMSAAAGEWQSWAAPLDGTGWVQQSGTDSFATVLANVTSLAFDLEVTSRNGTISLPSLEAGLDNVDLIPVPAAVWLFGSGLLGLLGVARRRKS